VFDFIFYKKKKTRGQNIDKVLEILEKIKTIALAHPPVDNKASRFGNPAFREFYDQLNQVSNSQKR
jgi:serine/threonine-protein phosphatase 2A activator